MFYVLKHFQIYFPLFYIFLIIMSIKYTQKITASAIQTLDECIWREIAIKAISKMPRIQLTNQSNKVFHDFALMNGHDPKRFLHNLTQQIEKTQTINDNIMIGNIKTKTTYRKLSEGDMLPLQIPKKKSYNINIRTTNFSNTQTDTIHCKTEGPKTCTQLFISQVPNEEEQIMQNQLRKTKLENFRYNNHIEALNRERMAKSQQHAQQENKKLKQAKGFTYDYEGRLLGMKVKQNGNIKFVHIKSKFYQNNSKEHRVLFQKLQKSKCKQVTDKKIIYCDGDDGLEAMRESKNYKNISPNLNNSFNDLFRDDKGIQMGVSIVDKATNSKIVGNKDNPLSKSVKLCDFKKSFKSASMVNRKKHQKLVTLESYSPKQLARIKTVSDAQSKILSSALSRYSKQLGKININNKPFMESFYNDHI